MSENEEQSDIALDPGSDIAVPPDRSLTMKPERLAGSPACLNCGTGLKGPFCYYCGQPDRNFMRFFPALLRELMSDFLELDSRFARTMKPLLFKPGKLTRDYLEGRRFRYAPPMRLYLFSSIAFFLLAAILSANAINISNSSDGANISIISDREAQIERAEEALEQLPAEVREDLELDLDELKLETESQPEEKWFDTGDFQFNDKPWDRETNPIDIKWLPYWLNNKLNDEVENSPEKAERIHQNPNLLVEQVFDILPATMFVLLPFVAMLFKFWYLFAKRYYVEHLIFALHNHAFIFVNLMLMFVADMTADRLNAMGVTIGGTAIEWLIVAMAVWIPLYLFISLRHVYRQNWFFTMIKFGMIGISYITLLGIVTSIVAVLSFILL